MRAPKDETMRRKEREEDKMKSETERQRHRGRDELGEEGRKVGRKACKHGISIVSQSNETKIRRRERFLKRRRKRARKRAERRTHET